MAKRKRLDVSAGSIPSDLETKSASDGQMRMPIAAVAGDTSSRAALEELSKAIQEAEEHGRLAKMIPITKVAARHLSRDRLAFDEVEMATLMASVKERGQQTPCEVLPLDDGTFGLISGLRRLEALCRNAGRRHTRVRLLHGRSACDYRLAGSASPAQADPRSRRGLHGSGHRSCAFNPVQPVPGARTRATGLGLQLRRPHGVDGPDDPVEGQSGEEFRECLAGAVWLSGADGG